MSNSFQLIDRIAVRFTRGVLRFRWMVVLAAVLGAVTIGSGAYNLEFASNYRVFFSDENPELVAFENLQATYTKNDNFVFVLEPSDGDAFSTDTLAAVESLTEAAWRIPFAIRVDSISLWHFSKTFFRVLQYNVYCSYCTIGSYELVIQQRLSHRDVASPGAFFCAHFK